MPIRPSCITLTPDLDTAKKYIRQINDILPADPEKQLDVILALEAALCRRAGILKQLSDANGTDRVERLIIQCLRKTESDGLDFTRFLNHDYDTPATEQPQ